jgi:N-methylhydantoinase A
MLMSDLRHDFVKAHRILTKDLDADKINQIFQLLKVDGRTTLLSEGVPEEKIKFEYSFDMMYAGQYYELSISFNESEMENISTEQIETKFHLIHEQLFGYSTVEMPVEVINFNLSALGLTVKPGLNKTERKGDSPVDALKGTRLAQLGSKKGQAEVPVYDGHILSHGNHVVGPAIIEQVVTTVIVPEDFNVICDKHENYVMYRKNRPPENISNFVEEVGGVKR